MRPLSLNLKTIDQHFKKPQVNLNLMLRQTLSPQFNKKQWDQIKNIDSYKFLHTQQHIMNTLLLSIQLFNKYFAHFYQNHVRLYHWYLLAKENKTKLNEYIFKKLLNFKLSEYKDKVQESQKYRQNQRKQKKKMVDKNNKSLLKKKKEELTDSCFRRNTINQYSKQIFNFLSIKSPSPSLLIQKKLKPQTDFCKTKQNIMSKNKTLKKLVDSKCSQQIVGKKCQKIRHQSQNNYLTSNSSRKRVDFHDLYIKTFYACDGLRYIFYDYERHMKGLGEKDKYNTFIRKNNNKQSVPSKITDQAFALDNLDIKYQDSNNQDFNRNSCYQYKQFGSYDENLSISNSQFYPNRTCYNGGIRKKNELVFRRFRSKNNGKFIRKVKVL